MIEPIMFFSIGFLAAGLLIVVIAPQVHNRAVRLTIRRLEGAMPLSQAELRAEKDQLRAQFAVSTRRLEVRTDELRAKMADQLIELSKRTDVINDLTLQLIQKTATIFSLETQQEALKDRLSIAEERPNRSGDWRVIEITPPARPTRSRAG